METSETTARGADRPNILVLCMDQWQTHMRVPDGARLPAMERLAARGVSFDRQYCTTPFCTPSRAAMWTGVHAVHTGLWDNTNFAYIDELSSEVPTVGHLLRERGYHTAFKGKWHLSSDVPRSEDALERYGFSDYQRWGEMFGMPLEGSAKDEGAASEAIDWLEHDAPRLDQPWLLVCSLVNPHDVMFFRTDPVQEPHPHGIAGFVPSPEPGSGTSEHGWDAALPDNFADDYALQPWGVRNFKEHVDLNYGRIPDDREDLWLKHRNYLLACMSLADAQFGRVLDALDRLDLWEDTVVLFTGDHGEMNGAHRMTQKGAIHFDEAAVVNLTVCAPDGPRDRRTNAVGSHLDLAPTLLEFAGLGEEEIRESYPHLKGRSLRSAVLDPDGAGPRGSADGPGDGALFTWDALHALDNAWMRSGALRDLVALDPAAESAGDRKTRLAKVGEKHGAPDFGHRGCYRAVVDGRHKLVRWFSPEEYANPSTLDELYARGDATLHDLVDDPGELENLAHPDHPRHDPALVEAMLGKLHALVRREIGEDRCPFDLDMFGTREVKHDRGETDPSRDV